MSDATWQEVDPILERLMKAKIPVIRHVYRDRAPEYGFVLMLTIPSLLRSFEAQKAEGVLCDQLVGWLRLRWTVTDMAVYGPGRGANTYRVSGMRTIEDWESLLAIAEAATVSDALTKMGEQS